jgi:uroporphyrinogen-III synthase
MDRSTALVADSKTSARATGRTDHAVDGRGEPVPPLFGFTIGLTADRRRDELAALLERRGAKVIHAPALRIVPLADDSTLLAATRTCLTGRLDAVVATTGIGFRGWMEAAEGWGVGGELRDRLTRARLYTRGPKVTGAVRAAGLSECWTPLSESAAEIADHLLQQDLRGTRLAVQLHGEPLPDLVEGLRAAGAEVVEVPVYRWVPPEDIRPVQRMVELVISGGVDAITFTSAPAVASLLATADTLGRREALLESLRDGAPQDRAPEDRAPGDRAPGDGVLTFCVGPVCAGPLERLGVPTLTPARYRLGALARTLVAELPARRAREFSAGGHRLRVQGCAVIVDGAPVMLAPKTAAVLVALAEDPGRVLSRAELLGRAGPLEAGDEHAVEMTVARLRAALGAAGSAVQTVIKRGYRLAIP